MGGRNRRFLPFDLEEGGLVPLEGEVPLRLYSTLEFWGGRRKEGVWLLPRPLLLPLSLADNKGFPFPEEVEAVLLPGQKEDLLRILRSFSRAVLDPTGGVRGFLLANGTGSGKTYVFGAFTRILADWGWRVAVFSPNEDIREATLAVFKALGIPAPEGMVLTYAKLEALDRPAVLVYDEAHLLKNAHGARASSRGRKAYELSKGAPFVLYVTATPFDRPWEARYLAAVGIHRLLQDTSFDRFITRFGVEILEGWNGSREYRFRGTVEDLARFHETLVGGGFMSRRLYVPSPGLVSYEAPRLELPKEGRQLLREVRRHLRLEADRAPPEHRGLIEAFRSGISRGILERLKLEAATPLIEELLVEGWTVALFLHFRSERSLKLDTPEDVAEYLQGAEEGQGGGVLAEYVARALEGLHIHLPSPLEMVEERFSWLGEGLAFYTGRETASERRRAKRLFDQGRIHLLVVTAQKGGFGLSLHDTTGRRPTAQVVLTLPWTAIALDQILGRTVRQGLSSPVKIVFPLAPSAIEAKVGRVIAERLRTLGLAVRGGEGTLPQEVVQAFEYGLAEVDEEAFLRLLEGAEEPVSEGF